MSKEEAKQRGLKHYFTGKPCVRGHYAVRFIYGNCTECVPLDHQKQYLKRREHLIAKAVAYNKANKQKLREKHNEYNKNWRTRNPAYGVDYYVANRERIVSYKKAVQSKRTAQEARRRAIKLNAIPNWLTAEDHDQMKQIYQEAKQVSEDSGVNHQVDHIVPLLGKTVCGLHVPWNLQILTAVENNKKKNKIISH